MRKSPWGIPAFVILLALACAAGAKALQSTDRRVIHVTVERFAFTPSEIAVTAGEEIELRLTSDDTNHGFLLEGTDINVAIPKRGGKELVVAFKAPGPGRYTFECNRMCGAGHDFMRGVLVVRARADQRVTQ
jgi:cytochrome c oxidase subunit 2